MKRITEGIPVDETLPDCPQSAKKKPSPWKAVGTIDGTYYAYSVTTSA